MNAFVQAVHDSEALRGELERDLIALGVVMIVVLIAWAIQAYLERAR